MNPEQHFTTKFVVHLGQNPKSGEWVVIISSNENGETKANSFTKRNLKSALNEAYIRMNKREEHNRKFPSPPVPEPSRIIDPTNIISLNGQ